MKTAWALLVLGCMMAGITEYAKADTLPAGATPKSGVVDTGGDGCIAGLPLESGPFILTDLMSDDTSMAFDLREGSRTGTRRLIATNPVRLQTGIVFTLKPCMNSQQRFTYSGYILPNPS